MPVYAYLCRDCGHAFDIRQEFTDAALTDCGSCGGRLRKQFGSIGVTFNGAGFYRTDSRSGSDSGSGGDKSSSEKSAPAKTEAAKPATPAPAASASTA